MDALQALWLGIIQGLTEFLPISSSAHLILVPRLLGWSDQGLGFDIAVHVGTLAAVMLHFRRQIVPLTTDTLRSVRQRRAVGESALGWALIIATLPLIAGALIFADAADGVLRDPRVIAASTIGFGLLLAWVVRRAGSRDEWSIGPGAALFIGAAQVLAIIPGTSRSGITMTAALWLGLETTAAARFSFLLSIPAIGLAGGWKMLQWLGTEGVVDWPMVGLGALVSGVSAYLCIQAFLALVARIGLMPFVIYRLILGAVLLVVFTGQ
jgi:undecaprenyl-diphosphatase